MCISAPVSFAAGGILIIGGAFATWKAWNVNKRYVPIALMPAWAGVQQVLEGHVWMGINQSDPFMVWWGSMGFIFFSWFMWPVWISYSVYALEPPESRRKKTLLLMALAGAVLGLVLFVPHLINPEWVRVSINKHSLAYEDTMFLDYIIPRSVTYSIYLFLIIAPPLTSTYLHVRLFGLTLVAIVTLIVLFFQYAYISVFCFLGGLGTLHLIYIILRNKCRRECPEIFT